MPYIVTTKRPEPCACGNAGVFDHTSDECGSSISRRAVATLEERQVFDAKQWREAGGDQPDGNEQFWHNALILAKHMERPEAPGPRREELATVLFLHDGRVSHGHFTSMMRPAVSPLPESGGTVTLPDGTVIEVEPCSVGVLARSLCRDGSRSVSQVSARWSDERIIADFNAKQASA
jgi:hypothetical protein